MKCTQLLFLFSASKIDLLLVFDILLQKSVHIMLSSNQMSQKFITGKGFSRQCKVSGDDVTDHFIH